LKGLWLEYKQLFFPGSRIRQFAFGGAKEVETDLLITKQKKYGGKLFERLPGSLEKYILHFPLKGDKESVQGGGEGEDHMKIPARGKHLAQSMNKMLEGGDFHPYPVCRSSLILDNNGIGRYIVPVH
jgi:hypothetical protein